MHPITSQHVASGAADKVGADDVPSSPSLRGEIGGSVAVIGEIPEVSDGLDAPHNPAHNPAHNPPPSATKTDDNNKGETHKPDEFSRDKPVEDFMTPKPLLPLAGTPLLSLTLTNLKNTPVSLGNIIVCTRDGLTEPVEECVRSWEQSQSAKDAAAAAASAGISKKGKTHTANDKDSIKCVTIPQSSPGSGGVITYLTSVTSIIPPTSNIIVIPGDIVLSPGGIFNLLADSHYRSVDGSSGNTDVIRGVTMMLSDVGESVTDPGTGLTTPVKESKKTGVRREEEEVDAIGYIRRDNEPLCSRLVIKENVEDIEARKEEEGTGETPKLLFTKGLVNWSMREGGNFRLSTDLSDLHVYVLTPWVVELVRARGLESLSDDLIPLLIRKQESGIVRDCYPADFLFGQQEEGNPDNPGATDNNATNSHPATPERNVRSGVSRSISIGSKGSVTSISSSVESGNDLSPSDDGVGTGNAGDDDGCLDKEFVVNALIIPRGRRLALRACTFSNYIFANREVVSHALTSPTLIGGIGGEDGGSGTDVGLQEVSKDMKPFKMAFPTLANKLDGKLHAKDSTLVLKGADLGTMAKKCNFKNSVIGAGVRISGKVSIKNSVILPHATIGEGTQLENAVVGVGADVMKNVSLKDCQVQGGATVNVGTKLNGECIECDN